VGGDRGTLLEVGKELEAFRGLRGRGAGLPSWKLAGPAGGGLRSGVICACSKELGTGDAVGEALRLRDEVLSRATISRGPCVM
jgi:hypothetical protein